MADNAPFQPGRPVGTPEQNNARAMAADPRAAVVATPAEQAEYTQFVSRFLLFISDTKKGPQSPGAQTLKMLNNSHMTVAQAIGSTTANIAFIIVKSAAIQKVNYHIDVLMHACFECVAAVYVLGASAGIFRGVPKFKGLNPDGSYNFDKDEMTILVHAQFAAVRDFGNMEVKHGMLSQEVREQNQQFWKEQIQYEVEHHLVDESVLKKIAKSGAFNHIAANAIKGQAGQSPQHQQPQSQSQPQPQQAQASQQPQQAQPQAPNPQQMAQQSDQQIMQASANNQPQNADQLPP